jgi:ABC-type polysaccharide/polyol phosphate transport system ATPase subunit
MREARKEKAIVLKNVGIRYKESKGIFKTSYYEALKSISFEVYKGETLGVIGRNGAGKSTLLRLLAGIIKPDKGNITHYVKTVSLMALHAGFDPNLSGRQNAIISGMLMGQTKMKITERLNSIQDYSELGEFFEKSVKTYSSGMKARLGFSVAMFNSPDVLLIDEVLGVGDKKFREKAEISIKEKIKSNVTVVLVTHSEHQIKKLADRAIWIDGGIVRSYGEVGDVINSYNSKVNNK